MWFRAETSDWFGLALLFGFLRHTLEGVYREASAATHAAKKEVSAWSAPSV
jgi:hypothetical protein